MSVRQEDFWRENHRRKDQFWLTGTDLSTLLSIYELAMPVGLDVTEIGVGLGIATHELAKHNRLTAVDISEEALALSRSLGAAVVKHVSKLHEASPADLVICHLVFQHCETNMVDHLLSAPLKPTGVYAFQTAYPLFGQADTGGWDPIEIMWHTRDEVVGLARMRGLIPFWERSKESAVVRGVQIGWSVIKCHKGLP